ncbi:MAG: 16S rRNA (cytidine(1402)-2'-O)-methyltransferase [Candidatus Nealsonbacteria bacterium RIFOXYB1_FULL_40_15]|uniref:Ribosomal RNA small subunit methyltransferase I n=2 Tax=Candidatus Nealsoniibacteriota TaxID=1817911 RepID=A0A1G2ETS6_9BACT|nr:MAG: 16S rRNA (cytidine(1402)-2'-O)-methyltransferase [Candidatus Nealsonbacteria bacterium RIFOXYB1_FULL_40_15]OGZ29194.1 MAG: 16S rRNA (cytidine(1402)-2'-O)-methyltransferase [Candidatus Nealsonbacteria bacterium RIFOXYC1_FULL_40_7]OGZ29875.1 MAG: 16S rRNA (cytidine(1402)-2'-O)-methyltransferase [Candidatus Nealsonbacteria bacterium RIFOXYD1_FULL_39_11]
MGELYIVATPIGNLKDITLRSLEVLKEADFVLAEDSRVTSRILDKFGIKKEIISYHQHTKDEKTSYILNLLKKGNKLALVSDSGTPGISDPGNMLVEKASGLARIIPIPGPSALTALASIAGFSMDKFIFLGFPPSKNKRKKFFEDVRSSKYPVIIYESTHRIIKTLGDIQGNPKIVLGRELTKKFETVLRGNLEEVKHALSQGETRGEFVLIIKNE